MVAADVRRLLLEELDPATGSCTLAIARLVDAPAELTASPDDLLDLASATLETGEVPIGPVEYADEPVDYALRSQVPVASITVLGAAGPTLKLALALGVGGCIGVGGNRLGHLPHSPTPHAPGSLLLPDLEAALAELAVYTRERARLIGYSGRVVVTMEVHSEWPITPCIVDVETGGIAAGAKFDTFPMLRFEYSLGMSPSEIDAVHYEAAREVARCFGVDEPQFLTPVALDTSWSPGVTGRGGG